MLVITIILKASVTWSSISESYTCKQKVTFRMGVLKG